MCCKKITCTTGWAAPCGAWHGTEACGRPWNSSLALEADLGCEKIMRNGKYPIKCDEISMIQDFPLWILSQDFRFQDHQHRSAGTTLLLGHALGRRDRPGTFFSVDRPLAAVGIKNGWKNGKIWGIQLIQRAKLEDSILVMFFWGI